MKSIGKKWSEIAKYLGGRTENAVKNRFQAICKRDNIDLGDESLTKSSSKNSSARSSDRQVDIEDQIPKNKIKKTLKLRLMGRNGEEELSKEDQILE